MTNEIRPASFDEFAALAHEGHVVPIVRTIAADLLTPVAAFLRVCSASRYAFLLESVQGGETIARYTFLGADPQMIVRGRGRTTIVEREGKTKVYDQTPVIDFLRAHFKSATLANLENLPPLAGGCIGYLGYEAARLFELSLDVAADKFNAADEARDSTSADDAVLMFFRTVLAFDHVKQQIEITNLVFTDEPDEVESSRELSSKVHSDEGKLTKLRALYNDAVERTARLAQGLAQPLVATYGGDDAARTETRNPIVFTSNWSREEFEMAVARVQEHIRRGDCYQAVLSQRLSANITVAPFEIYRALRRTNPAPYMYFLQLGDESIIGASPEMLVRARGRQLTYRPIAGTRTRGATIAEDKRLADELKHDAKEVAEHAMLVDLGRNDLGRVAAYGSVRVERLMTIEAYAHVQHLVSELSATLRDDCDALDALAACFPAGTVTGAPKLRAMNFINELEPDRRGIYAGAILYHDYAGNLDSCIAIRTILARDGKASVQAGAGIVFDSIPSHEYEETMNKARAMMRAIEKAEISSR